MQIHQREDLGVLIVSLNGKILGDSETCQLKDVIKTALDAQKKNIVLDLKHVEWMGSVGFGCITGGLLLARKSGGDLRLSGISGKVKRLLAITKLNSVFQTYQSVKEAVDSFSSNPGIPSARKTTHPISANTH